MPKIDKKGYGNTPLSQTDEWKIAATLIGERGVQEMKGTAAAYMVNPHDVIIFLEQNRLNPEVVAQFMLKGSPYQQAILAAGVSWRDLTPDYDAVLSPKKYPTDTTHIEAYDPKWYLCSLSEGRMLASAKDDIVTLVNGTMLAKGEGVLSAIAVESFSTAFGTAVDHCWYAPKGEKMRQALNKALDDGNPTVDIPDSTWVLMRPPVITVGNEDFFSVLEQTRQRLLTNQPLNQYIEGACRKEFRQKKREEIRALSFEPAGHFDTSFLRRRAPL